MISLLVTLLWWANWVQRPPILRVSIFFHDLDEPYAASFGSKTQPRLDYHALPFRFLVVQPSRQNTPPYGLLSNHLQSLARAQRPTPPSTASLCSFVGAHHWQVCSVSYHLYEVRSGQQARWAPQLLALTP